MKGILLLICGVEYFFKISHLSGKGFEMRSTPTHFGIKFFPLHTHFEAKLMPLHTHFETKFLPLHTHFETKFSLYTHQKNCAWEIEK